MISSRFVQSWRMDIIMKERILQFGEGNFLRGFVDYFIDGLNKKSDFDASVIVIQPLAAGMCDMINAQNGKYTTILRGISDGKVVEEITQNTCISRCINPYSDYEAFMACAQVEELAFVFSNTTEAGITFDDSCRFEDMPPSSFPAKVTQLLYMRYKWSNADASKGLVFIPCELIDHNGRKLHEYVLKYAALWGLESEFIKWIELSCTFASSLVDRIVTGFPRDSKAEWLERLGYEDNMIVTAEAFHLWVIEGMGEKSTLLPLDKHGYNVIFTNDIVPYKTRKVRILNGAHTMSAMTAHLAGYITVLEAMGDECMSKYIQKGMFEQIIPTIDTLPQEELKSYATSVLERFSNPYIQHRWLDICLNSIAKFKERVLPSLKGYISKTGELPSILTFSLAALIMFYNSDAANDTPSHIEFIKSHSVNEILANTTLWGEDLSKIEGLCGRVLAYIELCEKDGIKAVIEGLIL